MTFPTYADAVDIAQLEAAIAEMLSKRSKSGDSSGTIAIGQNTVDVVVNFATPFASTPRATATTRTTADYGATVTVRSAGSMTVRLHRPTGASTAAAATVPFDWNASDLGNA